MRAWFQRLIDTVVRVFKVGARKAAPVGSGYEQCLRAPSNPPIVKSPTEDESTANIPLDHDASQREEAESGISELPPGEEADEKTDLSPNTEEPHATLPNFPESPKQETSGDEPQDQPSHDLELGMAEGLQAPVEGEIQAPPGAEGTDRTSHELHPTLFPGSESVVSEGSQPSVAEGVATEEETTPPPQTDSQGQESKPSLQESADTEQSRTDSIKRGGRSRVSEPESQTRPTQPSGSRTPKPEIICWKRERRWILAVEIPEGLRRGSSYEVLQNAVPLMEDESREGCYRLGQIEGELVVRFHGIDRSETTISVGKYLIFKIAGDEGRRVKSPSAGSYLLTVPGDWDCGVSLAVPEAVSLSQCQGYFILFEPGPGSKIIFQTPQGTPVQVQSKSPRFRLVGNQLNDASENTGPLFGKEPPQIAALENEGWSGVGAVVVGEEGRGIGRWRTRFFPDVMRKEQVMPPEIAERKAGWYFVRIHDMNDDLVESLDFRFLCDLQEINTSQHSPFPSDGAHQPTSVMFVHQPGFSLRPADGVAEAIPAAREDGRTELIIPPDPKCDQTRWLADCGDANQVNISVLVERVWWALGTEHEEPSEWEDKPVTLGRYEFLPTSEKALWLRLPRCRWIDGVSVGFEQSKARRYPVRVTGKTAAVPLRDFSDSQEIGDRTRQLAFSVWIEEDEGVSEGVLAIVPATETPPISAPVPPPVTREWGRNKTSVAKAVLHRGSADIRVNGQAMNEYFQHAPRNALLFLRRLLELGQVHEILSELSVSLDVKGSRPSTQRQVKAVAHALARALMRYDPRLKPLLKQAGFGGVRMASPSIDQPEE